MLDGGPSRVQQSLDRRPAPRAEPVRRQPLPAQDSPTLDSGYVKEKGDSQRSEVAVVKKPQRLLVVVIILAVLACFVAGYLWLQRDSVGSVIDSDKYQAVFLTGGNAYYGKLEAINDGYFRLSEVFYIQSNAEGDTGDQGGSMQLIKSGNEPRGPEDAMIISRDQVLFFENLKADGKVSELIRNYKSGGN